MEELTGLFAVIGVFGSLTAICTLPGYLKYRSNREMQKTVRAAIADGQSMPAELIEVMTRDVKKGLPSRSRDIRRGVLWIAAGIGIALLGIFTDLGFADVRWAGTSTLGIASIPFVFGIAYLVLSFFNKIPD